MEPKKKYFVAIAGNIGVGKTTMTHIISEKLGWKAYFEPVIDNPYLDDFYQDMKRWSFHLQVFFLSKRFEAQKAMAESPCSCVQDRTIYEDAEIFAKTLYRQGFMSQRDYENYRDLFNIMTFYLIPPDLIVYLKANLGVLYERIKRRGRESEKNISLSYLDALNRAYDEWIDQAHRLTRVKVIDTVGFDPKEDEAQVDKIIAEIRSVFSL